MMCHYMCIDTATILLEYLRTSQSHFLKTKPYKASFQPYQEALEKSGYNFKLNHQKPEENQPKKCVRSRKITWFNPPFSLSVSTKIGEKFLKLVDKCFPSNHPLAKIIKRNTVKISYKCMPNMKHEIAKHNQQVQKAGEPAHWRVTAWSRR